MTAATLLTHWLCVCVSVQLYTLATTHPDRQAKCTVTQQVTRPAIYRIICELASSLNTVLPFKAADLWVYWIHRRVSYYALSDASISKINVINFGSEGFLCITPLLLTEYRLYINKPIPQLSLYNFKH